MRAAEARAEQIGLDEIGHGEMEPAGRLGTDGTPLSLLGHARATILLALPLIGAQLAQMALNVTDTVMVGRLGATELAAAVLGTQVFFIVYIFGSGFAAAMMPVAANAEGRGDARGVRRSVRMGLWVLVLYAGLVMVPLWHTGALLLWLDQEPAVARLAGDYVRVAEWAMLPALLLMGLRSYLTVVDRAYVVLAAILVGVLANGALNYAFIFGHFGMPRLGVVGAGVATLGAQIVMAGLLVGFTLWSKRLKRYELYARFWRPDWADFRDILRLGWPIGATIIAEVGLFAAASIMMGWIGTVTLAAHGIALQIASISFMVPLGIATAATVRVGLALGRGDPVGLGRAGSVALALGAGIALMAGIVLLLKPEGLTGLYLDRENPNADEVMATAVPLLLVAAGFQLFDSVQAVASGILRGLKDTRRPMLMALFAYWAVGMPVAYLMAFVVGLEGVGIWLGLAFGLATAAVLMTTRFAARERLGLLATGG